MERYAWKGRIKEGTKEEYIRRHKEIWPEMKAVLKEAGIANYSIWFTENELFGYYECEKGAAFAAEVQAKSPVVARWDAFMKDILIMEKDPAGRVACETCVTTGMVMVMGEITTSCYVDIPKIARQVIRDIGYTRAKYGFDCDTCSVLTSIDEQSPDIALGVDKALEA